MAGPVLSVSWRDHSSELGTMYKSLLANNFLVDCTLSAEGRSLRAHRLVLSACSPYFHMLFQEETGKHPFVILLNATFESLKAVIDFVYRGEAQIPEGNLKSFLTLAQSLQIKGLNAFTQDCNNQKRSRNTAGNIPRGPSEDNQDTCGVQCVGVSQKNSSENFPQHRPDHSDFHLDTVDTTLPFPLKHLMPQSESVITPPTPVRGNEVSADTEITVKEEPLFSAFSETVNKRLDNAKRNEAMSDSFISVMGRGTSFMFGEQDLNQHSLKTHLQQQLMESNEVTTEKDVAEKCQPLQTMILVSKSERLDNAESEENMDDYDVLGSNMNETYEETEHEHGEENLSYCPSTAGLPPEKELATQRSPPGQQSESPPPHSELQSHEGEETLLGDEGGTASPHSPNASTHKPRRKGKRPFPCEVCEKVYLSSSKLAIHKRIHTGERPYRCVTCGVTFTQKISLTKHQSIHAVERPFRCNVCGKVFAQTNAFACHLRIHTGERPFRCEVCNNTFTRKYSLFTHMRIHTGELPFRCDVCGKTFARSSTLAEHSRIHTGARPYHCHVCGKDFRHRNVLSSHKRRHTEKYKKGVQ
ncbi:Serendipity locus protein H-1, partial [Gryllus bimaculatus]